MFVPVPESAMPPGIAGEATISGVKVTVVAIGTPEAEARPVRARPGAKKAARPATRKGGKRAR